MVGGWGWGIGLGLGVDRGALVGDFSHIAVDMVSSVLHMLDPTVRESNRVRARDNTVGITCLGGVKVGLGVVIGDTVCVGVRLRGLLDSWVICWGSVHNRGSMNHRGSVIRRGGGMVHHRGSRVCWSRGMMHHWRHWAIGWSGMVDSMRHRMVHGMGHRVVHCVWHRVVDSMGHRVGNWMSNKTMVGNRVREVANLLDQRAGKGCCQQRGENESLEKSVVSNRKTGIPHWVFKITSHSHYLYLHFVLSRGAELDWGCDVGGVVI